MFHRLCKLFACHVRDLFGFFWCVQLLTVSTLRLNSRDYVRNRSTNDDPESSFNLSSMRIDASSEAYESKARQAGVSVTVHRSTTSNFARNKSHHDIEPAFEVPKPVTILAPTSVPRSILILFAGYKYHPFSKPRSNVGVEQIGS